MSRLTKTQREQVRQMFGGRCAYCGDPLPERWHVDHLEPVVRTLEEKRTTDGRWLFTAGPARYPERDTAANYMPACAPCNISKGRLQVEEWRRWLAGHVSSLNAYHPIYRLAKRYGLVQETGGAVVFHFERVGAEIGASFDRQPDKAGRA